MHFFDQRVCFYCKLFLGSFWNFSGHPDFQKNRMPSIHDEKVLTNINPPFFAHVDFVRTDFGTHFRYISSLLTLLFNAHWVSVEKRNH